MQKIKVSTKNSKPIVEEIVEDKKPNPDGKRKWSKIFLRIFLVVLGIGFTTVIALLVITFNSRVQQKNNTDNTSDTGTPIEVCTNILDPNCWTQAFRPELKKTNSKTSVLLVGIDSRESGSGSRLKNTDTLMLATIDHKTGQSRLISFPRDLYAPYGCNISNLPFKIKINAIYNWGLNNCEKDGLSTIARTVEKITGEKVDYTVLVKIEGVIQSIDDLGGIVVDVPSTFVDVYPYIELPKEYQQRCIRSRSLPAYCEFKFNQGPTEMDGQLALIYARMRQYSSDFERARRQQHIISAVKDKVLGDEKPLLEKARNLLTVYNNVRKYVEVSDFNLETILGALNVAEKVDTDPLQILLDPKFGGGGVIIKGEGSNFNFRDYTFKQTQDKLNIIYSNPELFKDSPKIYAVNYTGSAWASTNPVMQIKGSGLWFVDITTDTKKRDASNQSKFGIEIIDYSDGKKKATIDYLTEKFGADIVTVVKADSENGLIATTQYKENLRVNIYSLELPTAEASAE